MGIVVRIRKLSPSSYGVRTVFLFALLFLPAFSAHAEDSIADKLEIVYGQYRIVGKESPEIQIERLIALDQELRTLIDKPWMAANRSIDKKYWKEKYQTLGVGVGHYSESLGYSGKLLAEARALDVNLTHGSYTRYADICGGLGSFAGGCGVPNLEAALSYEKTFPRGPFIEDTLITLGNFYDDLFKALKESKQGYKYDCFFRYMKNEPVTEQRELARKSALHYYTNVLALGSGNQASTRAIKEWKGNLESGESPGWHFCTD